MLLTYAANHRLYLVLLALLVVFVFLHPYKQTRLLLESTPFADGFIKSHSSSQLVKFWTYFADTLGEATPRCALPHQPVAAIVETYTPGRAGDRADLIKLEPEDVDELSRAHKWFVEEISRLDYPRPPYEVGSSGVVTSAGGHFLPEAIVMIRLLRRTGSKLPVDVFFQDEEEFEPEVCDTVLKDLNAECHVISKMLDADNVPHRRHNITRYQVKAFAMLFSRFDNILWLDADELPLLDPVKLFESEPYASRGLVTWPDYWFPTSSHLFYKIASVDTPPLGLRASSETGQLLINKTKHLRTLELSAYYNYFGPSHYYSLLSQGAAGEGDKETFLAAAQALQADFWAVEASVSTLGYRRSDGSFHGVAILQADPALDYARTLSATVVNNVSIAFLHNGQFKPNAGRYAPLWKNEVHTRTFGTKEDMIGRFGEDLERNVWDDMLFTACEVNGYVFRDWVGRGDVCAQTKESYNELFKDG